VSRYYPYLYGPLASDLVGLASLDIKFEQGRPFTPLLQLLSVLPPQSAKMLPASYEEVMTNPESPLVDYYPSDFTVDANGKKNAWESIVRIPFIVEEDLISTVGGIDHSVELTETERIRNIPGLEHRFMPSNPSINRNTNSRVGVDIKDSGSWGSALQPQGGGGGRKWDNKRSPSSTGGGGGGKTWTSKAR
jgi:5'-3' exonuclease